ncbi:hypothetical protein GCM10009654_00990 [Streptomyces hebeiensis]|uniref:Uncharacterized protein n=1 Tax=Streptomyces hebeiensis TaxID=229486 RepID=A0ABN1UGH1_9ACTN
MGEEREQAEPGSVAGGVRRHGAGMAEADTDVTEDGEEDGADEERQLNPPALGEA